MLHLTHYFSAPSPATLPAATPTASPIPLAREEQEWRTRKMCTACGFRARQVSRVSGRILTPVTDRIRSASAALLFLVCLVTLTSAFNLPNRSPDLSSQLASLSRATKPAQQRTILTLADRVAYQRAIEEVYWRHRIWPKERPDPKPSLDELKHPE